MACPPKLGSFELLLAKSLVYACKSEEICNMFKITHHYAKTFIKVWSRLKSRWLYNRWEKFFSLRKLLNVSLHSYREHKFSKREKEWDYKLGAGVVVVNIFSRAFLTVSIYLVYDGFTWSKDCSNHSSLISSPSECAIDHIGVYYGMTKKSFQVSQMCALLL